MTARPASPPVYVITCQEEADAMRAALKVWQQRPEYRREQWRKRSKAYYDRHKGDPAYRTKLGLRPVPRDA